jgi:hypothetical protein
VLVADLQKSRFGVGVDSLFVRVYPDNEVNGTKVDVTSDSGQFAITSYYELVEWRYGLSSSGRPLHLVATRLLL